MDAESSSNVSQPRTESVIEYPRGTDSQVLRIKSSTTLWLMAAGNHHNNIDRMVGIVRTGEFAFHIIIQTQSPILITICMVGDLQWPLTKDTPVLRVGLRSFAFATPGLLYGLRISDTCCEDVLETLERVLMRFGHYEDHSGRQSGIQFSIPEDDPDFWAASQFTIENITQPFLIRLGATDKSPTCFDDTNERVLRVMRMSAVTKMITKGVLVGGIDPDEHIELFGPTSLSEDEDVNDIESRASATIFVFSDIVEAIEASGIIVSGKYQSMPPYEPKWTPVPNITFWNISKAGLIRILQVMVASATMNIEVMGDSTERIEQDHKVVDPMDEEPKIMEPIDEEMVKFSEFMEEVPNLEGDDYQNVDGGEDEDEVTAPIAIREIRFSIINEAAGSASEIEKNNPIEELREACASMEVA
ncbi:hypothetical protein BVC80_8601g3 [Macleaya cordata]|uniref:Uncharacterized protein n=1 Tax=Macleaya cordata TaxID=56857 RepID=A0A200PYK5_MACCD|nr:hypothetical protein BVC80_8601g3 [Macleaya cordata]